MTKALDKDEVKFIKDRISTYERRRDQVVLINFTFLAAVIGFSEKIEIFFIPLLLLAFLMFTTFLYRYYMILQHFCTAYLIENFEKNGEYGFETTYFEVFFGPKSQAIPNWMYIFVGPFNWLVAMNIVVTYGFFMGSVDFSETWHSWLYNAVIITGYLLIFLSGRLQAKRHISYFMSAIKK